MDAIFDLTLKPSLDSESNAENKEMPISGIYKAQAFVINSVNSAQTESNILYIHI